jgi:hypothetical protein
MAKVEVWDYKFHSEGRVEQDSLVLHHVRLYFFDVVVEVGVLR